jgi:phosphoribosylaminoimidazole-succinocarboxamide synthase
MVVRKTEVVPIECVVRGYLSGSGWKEYQQFGRSVRHPAAGGTAGKRPLPEPIFTPATKAEKGTTSTFPSRDVQLVGETLAAAARPEPRRLPPRRRIRPERQIIIADTKFEFGRCGAK